MEVLANLPKFLAYYYNDLEMGEGLYGLGNV